MGDITQTVSANGTLNPVVLVSVGTQVSGTVKKIYVDFNDKVEKGQVLMELDPSLFAAQVAQSEANLSNAKASLELAQANAGRMQELYKKEYISKQDLDTSVQALKSAQAQVALATAQLQKDRTNLNYSVIRSPVSGVVVARLVNTGQTVAASFQTPTLFSIAQDLSKMQIDTSFAEADIGTIKVNQPSIFTVDAFPNKTFRGSVNQVRLNPTTQQNVVTYDVVINVSNPEKILLPGMTAYVNIIVAQKKNILTVPNAALRFKPPEETSSSVENASTAKRVKKQDKDNAASGKVYTLNNGVLKPVIVTLGITDNKTTEILSGDIKAGDTVVTGISQDKSSGGGSSFRFRMF
jgi:HlyD family secretion protein